MWMEKMELKLWELWFIMDISVWESLEGQPNPSITSKLVTSLLMEKFRNHYMKWKGNARSQWLQQLQYYKMLLVFTLRASTTFSILTKCLTGWSNASFDLIFAWTLGPLWICDTSRSPKNSCNWKIICCQGFRVM